MKILKRMYREAILWRSKSNEMLDQDISIADSSLEAPDLLWQQYSLHGKSERYTLLGKHCLALRSELTFLSTKPAIDSMSSRSNLWLWKKKGLDREGAISHIPRVEHLHLRITKIT